MRACSDRGAEILKSARSLGTARPRRGRCWSPRCSRWKTRPKTPVRKSASKCATKTKAVTQPHITLGKCPGNGATTQTKVFLPSSDDCPPTLLRTECCSGAGCTSGPSSTFTHSTFAKILRTILNILAADPQPTNSCLALRHCFIQTSSL